MVSKYILSSDFMNYSAEYGGRNYNTSIVRSYLVNTIYKAFSDDIKNILKDQTIYYTYNDETYITDKIKCPSLHEVGLTYNYLEGDHGTIYPIFGDALIFEGPNKLSGREDGNTKGNTRYYWTRTSYSVSSNYVWVVRPDCTCTYNVVYANSGVIAIIRF